MLDMSHDGQGFRKPNFFERMLNKSFGVLVGLGIGLRHNYLLQVPGRKSGRVYSTPVDLLEFNGKHFLVAGRGRTQWVRNAEAAGEIALKRGTTRQKYRIRVVPNEEKPEILNAYLARFKLTVQQYFPVRAGSGPRAFAAIAERYPVFELLSSSESPDRSIG
jgi:deazaflavin-dependent oxidoreductase (nitroreductase family)